MVNQAILVGNLGKPPELKYTPGGQPVAHMRLATSRGWTDKATGERREETEWHDVEVWGPQAEACAKHLQKGTQVYVQGRLKTDRWEHEGRDYFRSKIVAQTVHFLGRKPTVDQPADDQDVPE